MLMPVPQTLAKKLNKDVFLGVGWATATAAAAAAVGREEQERYHAYREALGTRLRCSPGQRRGKDRRLTRESARVGKGGVKNK